MTAEPTPASPSLREALEITQADRQGAAGYCQDTALAARFIAGELDDHTYVQMFAKRRLAASAKPLGESGERSPELLAVEAEIVSLMKDASRQAGKKLNEWVGDQMREAAQRALATPATPDREAVARIVDPKAWRARERHLERVKHWESVPHTAGSDQLAVAFRVDADAVVKPSLAKADKLLSLGLRPIIEDGK